MSRAFVKEPDGDSVVDDAPELPVSPHPNHVTAHGLRALESEMADITTQRCALRARGNDTNIKDMGAKLEIAAIERRQRYLAKRIDSALVHTPEETTHHRVGFGMTVIVNDEEGLSHEFTIVGEDEAAPANGQISWTSPLARQLMDRQVGDDVRWIRPKGDVMLEVVSIRFD